ncbi:MAG: RHS repeat-associated core domain-containing protein [Spirochaetales bacterium]|nr:RHS repeat-associated core domain-containing protein [Spirochaetales bacterium]
MLNAKDNFVTPIASATSQVQHESAINAVKAAAMAALHQEEFIYNAADARTKYVESGSADKNYIFSGGHKIQNDGTNAYTYHANGAIDSDGTFDFEIDAFGRIVSVKSGATLMAELSYDAFGRPSSIKENGKPDKSFNYLGGFVEQENENGVASRHITIHPVSGVPIAYHTAANTYYTLFDSRFNLTGLLDTNGNLLETYRYKSFGVPQVFDSVGAIIDSSALGVEPIFGGQRYLSTTGLYLSKRRLMNPVNGVFLSGDPSGYQDSSSLYVYAAQDPINNIDPNGDIIPFIVAAFVIGGALAGAGYSTYDAYHNPNKYEGWQGSARVLGNVFGGAAIGGIAVVGGELVLAAGGTGIFATGTGLTATSLTATQTFVLYGSAAATTGAIGRAGFNNMFPEYIDPVSAGTIATDFVIGGAIPVVTPIIKNAAAPIVRPIINGGREMFTRAVGGNWRAFGTTAKLIWKGYSSNSRLEYGISRLFWNNRTFSSVSNQYWSQTIGRANGKALHHIFVQNQSSWMPQGFRNAGFNMLEIPASLNTWMGGRLWRELAFRGGVVSLLTATGLGSYGATSGLLDAGGDYTEPDLSNGDEPLQPNETRPTVK